MVDLDGNYMIPVGRGEILFRLAGIPTLHKLHLRLRVKSFITARQDPALPGRNFLMVSLQPT